MTTISDHSDRPPARLRCPLSRSRRAPTLVLALRDMREAHGRDPETGAGAGKPSWIGIALGMIVLDTLTAEEEDVGERWKLVLTGSGITIADAQLIYALRCALLHGYGLPKPENTGGRTLVLTPRQAGFALDTPTHGVIADVSGPLFCSLLVERIAAERADQWDVALINSNFDYSSA